MFSQALMGLAGPQDPQMGGMAPPMADPMADPMMMAPEEPMEEASAEETRVVEDLIRNYLYEQGRKRLEATRQYQENVAAANSELF